MQFYALDKQGKSVTANRAQKQHDYFCIECGSRVRLRGGTHRKSHFYHLDLHRSCRLQQKGMVHLQVQDYLLRLLPNNDCQLEYRFSEINRIADVAWLSRKIVFEVQCSPISANEILERNRDYQSQGWTVVWILHDQRYNQGILSPAERALADHPHYYTNMKAEGNGMVYDQFRIEGKRYCFDKLEALRVDLSTVQLIGANNEMTLNILKHRHVHWPYYFEGDLMNVNDQDYIDRAKAVQERHRKYRVRMKRLQVFTWLRECVEGLLIHPYRVFFRYMLEKACR